MKHFEVLTSQYFAGETEAAKRLSDQDVQRLMSDSNISPLIVGEETVATIIETFERIKSEGSEMEPRVQSFVSKEKFLENNHDNLSGEVIHVSSVGDFSIEAEIAKTNGLRYSLDSDSGAYQLAQLSEDLPNMADGMYSLIFLCNSAEDVAVINELVDDDNEELFDHTQNIAWRDSEGRVWPTQSERLMQSKYAVSMEGNVYQINNHNALALQANQENSPTSPSR